MVRVAISGEGLTEEYFVNKLLVPYFSDKNIFITPVRMNGNISVTRVQKELKALAFSFDKVTTLYDFYGFKDMALGEDKNRLENRIKVGLDETIVGKVYPYVQMYEFEGLLFSSPIAIGNHVSSTNNDNVSVWAQSVLDNFRGFPEQINNSPITAPSKRLKQYTDYKKTINGPNIAKEIGLPILRQKCPMFNDWISMIEGWA